MKSLRLCVTLACSMLAVPTSGCFYTYNNYYASDGGTSSSSSSGSSTSTSTSTSSQGSTGSSGSSGGTSGSSSGSSGGGACGLDAGWPLHCSAEHQIYVNGSLPSAYPIWDLTVAPLPGGSYLVGILLGEQSGVQFVAVAPDGGATDAGLQGCMDQNDNNDCPSFAISLVSTGASAPPTLLAGYVPPNTFESAADEFACWTPYDGTSPIPVDLSSVGASQDDVEVDKLSGAAVGAQIAVGVSDYSVGQDALVVGSVVGGCPASGAATVLHTGEVQGLAISPSGITGTPFITAEALSGPPDQLGVTLVPGGASYEGQYGSTGNDYVYWPAVASDGTTFAAFASSDSTGIQVFTGSIAGLSPIFDGGVLAPAPSFSLSATNCGAGCALAGWIENAGGEDGGPETPTFAFVDSSGCAQYVTMDSFTDDQGRNALTAVAYQAGSAVIVYASSYYTEAPFLGGRVNVRLCTP